MPINDSRTFNCIDAPYLNQYQMVSHEKEEILFAHFMSDKRLPPKSVKAKKEPTRKLYLNEELADFACKGAGSN